MMPGDIGGAIGGGGFITVQVDGQYAIRKIQTWGAQVADLSVPFEQVGYMLLREFAANFQAEGGRFGKESRWAPLSPYTVVDRERKGYFGPHPILYREGSLYNSTTMRGAPGNVFIVSSQSLEVGTNYPTAAWQHRGTSHRSGGWYPMRTHGRKATGQPYMQFVGRGGIPARPIIGFNNRTATQTIDLIHKSVRETSARVW